ncbi:MAG: hypothetical protein ACKOTH_02100, partial [Solirubrobacterales bacterium]
CGAGLAQSSTAAAGESMSVRQAAPAVDALWALAADGTGLSVCQDPTVASSISGCFGSQHPLIIVTNASYPPTTDGTNVYFGSSGGALPGAGYSCPIVDYGQNCTPIQIGWSGFTPRAVAAADGYLWLAYSQWNKESVMYRCPANLPYTAASSMPAACLIVGTSDGWMFNSLAIANGKLYLGLGQRGSMGAVAVCDLDAVNASTCTQLNYFPGKYTAVNEVALGAGYVWAGLGSGQIYRCSPAVLNDCQLWDTAGQPIVSLADDGQGTLWAAANGGGTFTHPSDVVWSCPEATANACKTVISNVFPQQVTAGAGQGFSSVSADPPFPYPPIAWGAQQYPQQYPQSVLFASNKNSVSPGIIYIPAGGVTGLGGVRVRLAAPKRALARVCAERDSLPARVVVRGPHKARVVQRLDLCKVRRAAQIAVRRYDLLYPGAYSVRVRSSKFSGTTRIVVKKNRTPRVTVSLAPVKRS